MKHLSMPVLLLVGLLATIPAFYLSLEAASAARYAGQLLYGVAALLLAIHLAAKPARRVGKRGLFDGMLFVATIAGAWPSEPPWPPLEWFLRLVYCAAVFARLVTIAARYMPLRQPALICTWSLGVISLAGGGFYWLEPQVHSYADGLWLAFTTGATVGYGDIVPSTPASRVLAVFIVILGFGLLSLVTASIAALMVGEDEKRMRRELHADMRILLREIAELRAELMSHQDRQGH